MTVFAHTEPGVSSPAYINISEKDAHVIVVSVRTRGAQTPSHIDLSHDEVRTLYQSLGEFLTAVES